MKWANHLEATKQTMAMETTIVLAAADITPCLVAATIPIETMVMTCKETSSVFRLLYA